MRYERLTWSSSQSADSVSRWDSTTLVVVEEAFLPDLRAPFVDVVVVVVVDRKLAVVVVGQTASHSVARGTVVAVVAISAVASSWSNPVGRVVLTTASYASRAWVWFVCRLVKQPGLRKGFPACHVRGSC